MSELFCYEYSKSDFSNKKPKYLVIFLHGYGANGSNLIELAKDFEDILPESYFISPNAVEPWEGGFIDCYQWFSLASWGLERDVLKISSKIRNSNQILKNFIDLQLQRFDLKPENLILVGFSQGAMMAMYQGFVAQKEFAGIIAFSGKLILPESVGEESSSKPEICLIHGKNDSVVGFENFLEAQKTLQEKSVNFESHAIENLDHSIDIKALRAAKDFLRKVSK